MEQFRLNRHELAADASRRVGFTEVAPALNGH
jgi:hypothetical protein